MVRARKKSFHKRVNAAFKKVVRDKRFPRFYLIGALVLLFTTTVYWSLIGALIQSSNADQTANSFLFENGQTIAGATFPSQHTFILKVPLFWIIGSFHGEPVLFTLATVLVSLLTVAGLFFVMTRIERRPVILGTLALALAAVLLYIPAQSYPGSLLPANFAMLTTRNVEYVLFMGALILGLRARTVVSVSSAGAALTLGLLFASDKLFVSLALGTILLSASLFALMRRKDLFRVSVRLFVIFAVAYLLSAVTLFVLERSGVRFDAGAALGPYGFVRSPKDAIIALVYAVMGIFINLGANPAFATLIAYDLPAGIIRGVLTPYGLGYAVTIAIAIIGIRAVVRASRGAFERTRSRTYVAGWRQLLPLFLALTVVTAFVVYVVSNHYYPADARYLSVVLFAIFVGLAAAAKRIRVRGFKTARLALPLLAAIIFGIVFQAQNLAAQDRTLGEITRRNDLVTSALKTHPVTTLVGNYWRVLPIKSGSQTIQVTPLQNCTEPRGVLSSSAWQPDLTKTRFAYILRLDGALADFPRCTLKQITDAYGRPDSSIVIAGTRANPKELLLFYDDGVHRLKLPAANNTVSDTVKPVAVGALPFTTCSGKTVMQFVAHEDDDILFMNPDLTHDLKAGSCIRTVFFTAGDAGSDSLYWLGRQHGAEAAYNTILGTPDLPWTERVAALDGSHFVTVANPRGNHSVSLIFLHLPDGNPEGAGFGRQHFESLRKLYDRSIPAIHSIDDNQAYTSGDLVSGLTRLMETYKPSEVRSQSTYGGTTYRDHSDHNAVGEFTTTAFKAYQTSVPDASITYYLGYPVHGLPPNVEGTDFDQKVAAFLTFGHYDNATCRSLTDCNRNSVYGIYLGRQYTYPY